MSTSDRVIRATGTLRTRVDALRFAPPTHVVYNPIDYARRAHHRYIRRFADGPRKVIFLGMNPGPYGMVQTGVPFGEVSLVREFLGIEEPVGRPAREHPRRPVLGFACPRSEVSGARLWGAIRDHYGRADRFFARHYVANYCPLVFMEESGRNRTPDKLPRAERAPLFEACDAHLRRLVRILEPEWLIGIGAFAARRAEEALAGEAGDGLRFGQILHPSPANPTANRDWAGTVRRQLADLGLCPRAGASAPRW